MPKQRASDNPRQAVAAGLLSDEQAVKLLTPDFCGRIGFPSYALQNNNANIRRMKQRYRDIEERKGEETTEQTYGDVRVVDNVEENRLQVFFPDKPAEDVRRQLKQSGFRWARSIGAWQAYRNSRARYCLEQMFKQTA